MKRNLWLFLLKLLPATLILGWLWFTQCQHAYPYWIDPIATFFFKLFGVRTWHLALTAEHFTNLVPYLALLLATPGIIKHWRRSLLALFGGLVVIVLVHMFMSVAIYFIVEAYSMSKSAYRLITYNQFRLQRQRPGHSYSLPLPAGKLMRIPVYMPG